MSPGRIPPAGATESEAEAELLRGLGQRVRALRRSREWTQEDLAKAAFVSRGFVSLMERGDGGVDIRSIHWVAAAFRVPLHDLLNISAPLDDSYFRPPAERAKGYRP